jgi:hypothetical protein
MSFLLSPVLSLQQYQGTRGQNRFYLLDREGELAHTMYTYVSKCKNDKIKGKRKKILSFS